MKSSLVKTNNTFLFFLILLSQITFGQTFSESEIYGKIIVDSIAVEGINIVNTSNEKAASSDKSGMFSILAKEGDVLVISAVNLVTLHKRLTIADLALGVIDFQMSSNSIKLEEVIINENSKVSAVNLGIVPIGQKKYTPAARKLYTARSGLLDRPLNWMSGRTSMLKKEVAVEYKEQLMNRLKYVFEDKYYVRTLKIPQDYIRGFQYYCIEDIDFVAALNAKNNTLCMFLIITLAKKYIKTIANEN
jgi:hypothetical protein